MKFMLEGKDWMLEKVFGNCNAGYLNLQEREEKCMLMFSAVDKL